jgi:triosephosphate isomerase (TIM)
MRPVILVNFKTYPAGTGARAVKLAKVCEEVAKRHDADIRVAVQAADIYRVASAVSIPVYAEHIDAVEPGRNTGFILPEDVKAEGAAGTLLNHSEHRLTQSVLEDAVKRAKAAGLKVIICAATPADGKKVAALMPEFVAIEPPELIGGDVSVSAAKPDVIRKSVEWIASPVLVGAGIHTNEDLRVARTLGARGVLLASGVVLAKDPKKVLERLLGF